MEKALKDHSFEYHIQKNDLKKLIELYMVYKHTLRSSDKVPTKD
jgi:hypothetical protein